MRQSILTIIILSIFSIRTDAQILYECTSQNGDTVFYVFGTCHVLPSKAKVDTLTISRLIRSSDVIFSELFVDDGDTSYKSVASKLNEKRRYKNNGSLKDSVTKEQYEKLMNYYRRNYGVSKKEFRWATYDLPLRMDNRLRYSSKKYYSLDSILYTIAKRSGKIIKNLDNEELLYSAYSYLSSEFDTRWLINKIEGRNIRGEVTETFIQLYLQKDTVAINSLHKPSLMHQKILVNDRNKHWFTIIERNAGRTNFIYCGIAHLISGELSLLNYFKRRQFAVKAVEIDIADTP
jgi:uncharacterized protein YbaP (TraB family)